ncbi:MAG: hypothetical protein GY835_07675 [bacterium]|nr:hypothetical protein [bacterium]
MNGKQESNGYAHGNDGYSGEQINYTETGNRNSGRRIKAPRGKQYKSQVLASLLSLMPGLGQVYVGYYQRGFTHAALVAVVIMLLASDMGALTPMFGVFLPFFWLYNIIDAGRRAAFYNMALDGGEEVMMPADFAIPTSGSLGGGLLLIGLGLILFLNTRFDMSLDWVAEYWPLFLVGLGIYLVVKRRQGTETS